MRTITVKQFHEELDAQNVPQEHLAFICTMCGVVQSATSLFNAGAAPDLAGSWKHAGFSCVGRWTGAGSPRKAPDGNPCNWTLGGLFNTAKLHVIDADGEEQVCFEIASPEQAQALMRENTKIIQAIERAE